MDEIEADENVGAIVVTGAPPAFCAGADLGNLGGTGDGPGFRTIYEGFLRVARSPLPTIAAVNGAAVGAGMNMALGCDLRIAAKRAKFDTRFIQIGLHPGGGHTWMLRRIVGPQVAAAAVLFGEVLDGEAAERVGLAYKCVDDDDARGDRAHDRRPRRRWAAGARDQGEGDARRDGDDRLTRRGGRVASSRRRCGRRRSRGSASVSPRYKPRSRRRAERRSTSTRRGVRRDASPTPRRSSRSARGLPTRR